MTGSEQKKNGEIVDDVSKAAHLLLSLGKVGGFVVPTASLENSQIIGFFLKKQTQYRIVDDMRVSTYIIAIV